jgi:hypothetical protein
MILGQGSGRPGGLGFQPKGSTWVLIAIGR